MFLAPKTANQALSVQNMTRSVYDERRNYKNISIYLTELPPTPTRFRDKYHRGYTPGQRQPETAPPPQLELNPPQIDLNKANDLDNIISVPTNKSAPQEDHSFMRGQPDLPSPPSPNVPIVKEHGQRWQNSIWQNRTQSTQMRYVSGSAYSSRRLHTLAGHSGYGGGKFIRRPPPSEFIRDRLREKPYPWEEDPPNPRYTGLEDPEVWANAFIF